MGKATGVRTNRTTLGTYEPLGSTFDVTRPSTRLPFYCPTFSAHPISLSRILVYYLQKSHERSKKKGKRRGYRLANFNRLIPIDLSGEEQENKYMKIREFSVHDGYDMALFSIVL